MHLSATLPTLIEIPISILIDDNISRLDHDAKRTPSSRRAYSSIWGAAALGGDKRQQRAHLKAYARECQAQAGQWAPSLLMIVQSRCHKKRSSGRTFRDGRELGAVPWETHTSRYSSHRFDRIFKNSVIPAPNTLSKRALNQVLTAIRLGNTG